MQIHKDGDKFLFFSRSLKPVLAHKVEAFKTSIPKACPHGDSMIIDCEVLMMDTKTGKPLPFGTLGIHKKQGNDLSLSLCFSLSLYVSLPPFRGC